MSSRWHCQQARKSSKSGYADDLALVVTAKTTGDIKENAETSLKRLDRWLKSKGLDIAPHKTEAAMLAGRKKYVDFTLAFRDTEVSISKEIRYLGFVVDNSLRFEKHLAHSVERARKQCGALQRLMPNIPGPKEKKRRVLATTAQSTILYGAAVWQRRIKSIRAKNLMISTQRQLCKQVCSAYRTISAEAVGVIAGMLPLDLRAKEAADKADGGLKSRAARRKDSIDSWQERWTKNSGKAEWTKRLIPDLRVWIARSHGQVGYELTQFLSGHGAFNAYLQRMKIKDDGNCAVCQTPETAEHVFFECRKWSSLREETERTLGTLQPDTIIEKMLLDEVSWAAAENFIRKVVMEKKDTDRGNRSTNNE